jgi:hypothetical protein
MQASVANSECVAALQLFGVMLNISTKLDQLQRHSTYKKIPAEKKFKVVPPEPLADAMKQLKEISDQAISQMPT